MWEISVPSAQACCEPQTALKKKNAKLIFKKKPSAHLMVRLSPELQQLPAVSGVPTLSLGVRERGTWMSRLTPLPPSSERGSRDRGRRSRGLAPAGRARGHAHPPAALAGGTHAESLRSNHELLLFSLKSPMQQPVSC